MSFECLIFWEYCGDEYLETQSEVYGGAFLQK